jgi:hypothetical protein
MKVLLINQLNPANNGVYNMNFTHAMDNNIGEKMKVIIELNEDVSLISLDSECVTITIDYESHLNSLSATVNIDDLKLALRKLTAK